MQETLTIDIKTVTLNQEEKRATPVQYSCRGFVSIDQEMEREIALTFFNAPKETVYGLKSFSVNKGF